MSQMYKYIYDNIYAGLTQSLPKETCLKLSKCEISSQRIALTSGADKSLCTHSGQ